MKIYISADIEGVSGIVHWDEASRRKEDYSVFRDQMENEVGAACEGANEKGASEIWVKDAHGVGRNLSFEKLPVNAKLIRSFSGHPFCMMQELDETFDGVLMIGYHSFAGSTENPLAHTMVTELAFMKINGKPASEFLINAYTAASVGVPVIFVSGDAGICKHVKEYNDEIETVITNIGIGDSVISNHPKQTEAAIREGVSRAMTSDFKKCAIELPKYFRVELGFVEHAKAYRASFYPGMKMSEDGSLSFETNDYFDVLRMLNFVI